MKFALPIMFIASLSYSLITQATIKSAKMPSIFEAGPTPLAIAKINLKTDETVSLILLESVMQVASLAVLVNSCQSLEGSYPIEITTDGSINKPGSNFVIVNSPKKSEPLVLNAIIETPGTFRGLKINIRQGKKGKLKETAISEYSADATFNRELTLLSMHGNAKILGQNNIIGLYQNELLKNLYKDKTQDSKSQKILGWGMASLLENNFPINTFWARFEAFKSNSQLKTIVLQQDRLTGTSSCRIVIEGTADIKKETEKEKQKSFILKGAMTISRSKPNEGLSN